MTTLTTKPITSLQEYTQFIEQLPDIRWYRGCAAKCELKPSLYRHPIKKDSKSLLKQENEILMRFRQRSTPYITSNMRIGKDIDALFIMQHFGVPTRLLDWTENPYTALYFALNDSTCEVSAGVLEYKDNVCVWVLDPIAWNKKSLDVDPPPGIIYSFNDEFLSGYEPTNSTNRKPDPVALYGIYNNPRIVVQKGVFTLFGSNVKPMEKLYVLQNYPQDCLFKLSIAKRHIGNLVGSLKRIGVTDTNIFPDLDGLAKELKREFGYRM